MDLGTSLTFSYEIIAINSCWERESNFSLIVYALVDQPCSIESIYVQEYKAAGVRSMDCQKCRIGRKG